MLESGVNETDLVERQTSRRDSIAALLLGRLPVTLESNVEDQARLRLRRTHGGQDAFSGALRRAPSGRSGASAAEARPALLTIASTLDRHLGASGPDRNDARYATARGRELS